MDDLRLPWHRETIGHTDVPQIVSAVRRDLQKTQLDAGVPMTDATWIVNADNKVVAFVGNGPRQTENADAIIAALPALDALRTAIATVCRCSPPHPGPYAHKDECPVWQYGFTAAREILGIER